jgi:hypothetical protein
MNLGPSELLVVLFVVALPLAFGWLTAHVAAGKGYSAGLFFVIGLFSGVVGLIIAAVIPPKPK